MFRRFPASVRSTVAGIVLGDAPLPRVPGFCKQSPMQGATLGSVQAMPPAMWAAFVRKAAQRRARQTSAQSPTHQLEQGILHLMSNASEKGLEPTITRVTNLALAAGLTRLGLLVKVAGHRLRLHDMPADENWPGTQTSIRDYIRPKWLPLEAKQVRYY